MNRYASKISGMLKKGLLIGATAVMPIVGAGCYTSFESSRDDATIQKNADVKSFTGYAMTYDSDKNRDLDFIMNANNSDEDKTYQIQIHEDWDESNINNLNDARKWIKDSYDGKNDIQVIGQYTVDEDDGQVQKGTMNPFAIIKVNNDASGKSEEVLWTDSKDSKMYLDDPVYVDLVVTNLYTPGHFIRNVHYPYKFSPFWDVDGDGIPNRFDPDPYNFGPWVDMNRNNVWDWYDPWFGNSFWTFWGDHYHHPHTEFVWRDYYGAKPLDDKNFLHHKDNAVRNFGNHRGLGDYRHDKIQDRRNISPNPINPQDKNRNNGLEDRLRNQGRENMNGRRLQEGRSAEPKREIQKNNEQRPTPKDVQPRRDVQRSTRQRPKDAAPPNNQYTPREQERSAPRIYTPQQPPRQNPAPQRVQPSQPRSQQKEQPRTKDNTSGRRRE